MKIGNVNNPADWYVYLQAGSDGTFSLQLDTPATGSDGYWQIDNGQQNSFSVPTYPGTTNITGIAVPAGTHVLLIHWDSPTSYDYAVISNFSQGYIVEALGAPSYVAAHTIANSGVLINGDFVSIGGNEVSNSQIINESGNTIQGNKIVIAGNMADSSVEFASLVDLNAGALSNAVVTVPSGISGTTIIYYSGTIAQNLTTTSAQTTYVGTDLIPNYSAPSSDPAMVRSVTVTTDPVYVPPGNTAAYTDITDNGVVRVDGDLLCNNLTLGTDGTLILTAGAHVTLGAFN